VKKFAGNQKEAYRSVMKTILPKQQTWGRAKRAPRWTFSFISANW